MTLLGQLLGSARFWELAGVAAGAGFGWFIVRATVLPRKSCRRCGGTGRNPWGNSDRSGPCWFCHGEPWRVTGGARLVRGQTRFFRSSRWGR